MALLLAVASCRTPVPIENPEAALPAMPRGATLDDVSEAIWRAGRKLGWNIEREGPGELVGTLRVRSHVAVVSITHDRQHFAIRYRDSDNLDVEDGRIHPNYNVWVSRLVDKIRREPVLLAGP
jgi:hypothetical protein